MADAAPRHVGDVQQAVDAAEIDERAVVGDVLHHAAQHLAFGERLERLLLLLGVLLFEEDLAREDDVAALLVDLDDAHPELLPLQRVEVADRPHVDLAAGQERAHADVDGEAALDALDDAADHDLLLGEGALDLVPNLHLLGLLARQHDVAFTILGALEQHVDDVAGLHGDLAGFVEELVDGDDAFGLVADVDDDFAVGDFENRALDDFAFRYIPEAVIVKVQQAGIFLRVHIGISLAPGRCGFERLPARRLCRRGRRALRLHSRVVLVLRHDHCGARPPDFSICRALVSGGRLPADVRSGDVRPTRR